MLAKIGFLPETNQAPNHPLEETLALFFIIITGKVYALSLMHTINSRRAMRERFKSHDFGRTSLSRFQWPEPRTFIGSNDLSTPEVCDPHSTAFQSLFERTHSRTRSR